MTTILTYQILLKHKNGSFNTIYRDAENQQEAELIGEREAKNLKDYTFVCADFDDNDNEGLNY